MKAETGIGQRSYPRLGPRLDPDRGEHPGAYYPGAPVWEPGEGLDAFFPDASAESDTGDDED